ncbi:hypothetical protein GGR55DRAFT_621969 [Xylaria sp. FL0064]|nr:hypothetical protein GGR55DRAFT_621969 [Xylaria sp. FL0064]
MVQSWLPPLTKVSDTRMFPCSCEARVIAIQFTASPSTSTTASATTMTTLKPTQSQNTDETVPRSTIAGAVISALAGIAFIIGLFWVLRRKSGVARGLPPPYEGSSGVHHYDEASHHDGGSQYTGYSTTQVADRAEINSIPYAAKLSVFDRTKGRSEMP